MRIEVIFILLLLVPLAYAQEEYQNYQGLNINAEINAEVNMDSGIDYFSSELFFFPMETEFQKITRKEYSHNVIERGDSILYEWNDLGDNIKFSLDYDIASQFSLVQIKNKIPFPIEVPDEYGEYLEATALINSDNVVIKETAEEIIGDEDDLYEMVYKLGDWANKNIEYSLTTLTEELTQNSVWVLQNRKGVCDELTVLFIAMLRSQGIPAKFISGSSYTNIIPGFGNHAWAEVYFPGKGWVPYDVTYGQYGYVDATHIKMRESSKAKEPSVSYRWTPGGKNIDVQPLNISAFIASTQNKLPGYVNIKLNVLNTQIKSGSYLPLEIELENTRDYYLTDTLYITKAPTDLEGNIMHVMLRPNEKRKVYWIITVPDGLDDQYLYTSKIELVDFFGSHGEGEVEYANKYSYYSLEEAEEKVHQLELENRNPEDSIDLFCSPDRIKYYPYENATLVCRISNSEQKAYGFNLCFFEKCERVIINPSEEKEIAFDLQLDVGNQEYHAIMTDDEIIKSSYFDVNVLNIPEIKVENINHPQQIRYKDSGEINFDLSTESPARNLVISMNKRELFRFDSYVGAENIILNFNGKDFYRKDTNLIFEYEDDNGRKYRKEQEISINVTNAPFYIVIGYWWFLLALFPIIFLLIRKKFSRT